MHATGSSLSLTRHTSDQILEQLCLALREVGVVTNFLQVQPPDPGIVRQIQRVRELDAALESRGIDPHDRLTKLTVETHWMMPELLRECLDPTVARPWVRDARDGLRIAMRCLACAKAEFPAESRTVRLCGACLAILEGALASRTPRSDLLLYRTYQPTARCQHADDDTVLGVFPWSLEYGEGFTVGLCKTCIREEVMRRRSR